MRDDKHEDREEQQRNRDAEARLDWVTEYVRNHQKRSRAPKPVGHVINRLGFNTNREDLQ